MGDTIKEFLVGLGFQIDEAGLKNFVDGITNASMRAAVFGAAVTAAAGAAVAGIYAVAKETEELDLLAQRLGSTAAEVDDFADVAELMGISSDKTTESLKALNKTVNEAALGVGRGKVILEKLGIAAKDSSGKVRATTDVMADLQAKLATMDRGQAMTVMEKLGLDPEMVRMFNGELGDAAYLVNEMNAIDASLGFDFDEMVARSKEFQQAQRGMSQQAKLLHKWFATLWEKLATTMMPKVTAAMERLGKVMEGMRRSMQGNGKRIVEGLEPFLAIILRIGESFMTFVSRTIGVAFTLVAKVVGVFNRMNEASGGWVGYLAIALAAWKMFNLGFLATPIGAIIGVSVAILALYDDFMTWKEGGNSLIDWSAWEPGIAAALGAIDAFIGAVTTLADAVGALIGAFVKLFSGDFAGFFSGLSDMANSLIDTFKGLWDTVSGLGDAASGIMNAVGDIFGGSPSAPAPQARAAVAGATANVNQATTINVSGGANPQATAQAVAAKQKDVNASMARNVKGAAR